MNCVLVKVRINEDPNDLKDSSTKKKKKKNTLAESKSLQVATAIAMGLLMKTTLAFTQGLGSVQENVAINISVHSGI